MAWMSINSVVKGGDIAGFLLLSVPGIIPLSKELLSRFLKLDEADIVQQAESEVFLNHLTSEFCLSVFRDSILAHPSRRSSTGPASRNETSKFQLLQALADRINELLPHTEANLHPGLCIR